MLIVAQLEKEFYEVYNLREGKKLKKSTTVYLKSVDPSGTNGVEEFKYNMPDQEIKSNKVNIKYKGSGRSGGYWSKDREYTIITEQCEIFTDISKAHEDKKIANQHVSLLNLKRAIETRVRRLEIIDKNLIEAEKELSVCQERVNKLKRSKKNNLENQFNYKLKLNELEKIMKKGDN